MTFESRAAKNMVHKTQVGPGSWIRMTQDKSLKDEPQVLLGHLEFWVAIFFRKDFEKGLLSVVGFRRISVVQLNLQTQRSHMSLLAFFPRLFLTRSYRKGFERWEASGPGCAGLRFRKSKDQKSMC